MLSTGIYCCHPVPLFITTGTVAANTYSNGIASTSHSSIKVTIFLRNQKNWELYFK
jgi:hypothetical protein